MIVSHAQPASHISAANLDSTDARPETYQTRKLRRSGSTLLAVDRCSQHAPRQGSYAGCSGLTLDPASYILADIGTSRVCGDPVIVRWISSESVRAPTFFMAVARWVSTVLWLMPKT